MLAMSVISAILAISALSAISAKLLTVLWCFDSCWWRNYSEVLKYIQCWTFFDFSLQWESHSPSHHHSLIYCWSLAGASCCLDIRLEPELLGSSVHVLRRTMTGRSGAYARGEPDGRRSFWVRYKEQTLLLITVDMAARDWVLSVTSRGEGLHNRCIGGWPLATRGPCKPLGKPHQPVAGWVRVAKHHQTHQDCQHSPAAAPAHIVHNYATITHVFVLFISSFLKRQCI